MSDSVRPHRQMPTRLPSPWDSPGKNTGVGCHFLLQCRKVKSESEVVQSCLTLSRPMDCSLPDSSIHGISRQEYWSGVPLPSPVSILVVPNSFPSFPWNPLQLDSGPRDNQYSSFCCQWNSSQSSCYSSYLIAALIVNPFLFSRTPSSLRF